MGAAAALSAAPHSADGAVIRVSGLHKRYRRRVALADVSLEVKAGVLYGLIGPDGAGKSSLMKAVAGLLACEAGGIELFGEAVDSEASAERLRDRVGFMPQGLGLNLYPDLSVEENIDFLADLRAVPARTLAERKARLLAMTRLGQVRDRAARHLSGGMKQKLALVCTLIHEPRLIILDEPTTGVDPVSRRDFWRILAALVREGGMTALVSTAYLDEASRFDRAALMYGGRILTEGTPDALAASAPEVPPSPDAPPLASSSAALAPAVARTDTATRLEELFIAHIRAQDPQAVAEAAAPTPVAARAAPWSAGAHADAAPAVQAHGLVRDFGAFRAVDEVSFDVRPGEILGLLGANGAGKTTVIKMLTGILTPTRGSVRVAGADMRRAGRELRRRIGYLSQTFSLYADLTVRDNLALYAGVYGLSGRAARERTDWALALGQLGTHARDTAGSLPMGLRQRLALGCALLHRPQVLFLDEPTSGVDPLGRRRFWSILFSLARSDGVCILLTTHHMSEADLCDRVVLMAEGRVVDDAAPSAMKARVEEEAGTLLEVRAEPVAAALDALVAAGYAGATLHGRGLHLFAREPSSDEARIRAALAAAGIADASVAPRAIGMEDVFIHRIAALRGEAAADGAAP